MTKRYRQAVRDMAEIMRMSDIEVADYYNSHFGTLLPGSIYKHVNDAGAAKLLEIMSQQLSARESRRGRR